MKTSIALNTDGDKGTSGDQKLYRVGYDDFELFEKRNSPEMDAELNLKTYFFYKFSLLFPTVPCAFGFKICQKEIISFLM